MATVDDLRKQSQALFEQAEHIESATERFPLILRAIELQVEADSLEHLSTPQPVQQQTAQHQQRPIQQQQQQPQPDDDKKE